MGINGLLQQLKSISKPTHVSSYGGHKVAIDGYSWLHKGAYSCSQELCEGRWAEGFVRYFVSRVDLLRSHQVIPIVVFDGCRLPMKADEEESRGRGRREALERARAHAESGNTAAASECYQRAVDIAPWMAKVVMEALRERGVTCLVAPYEADAQMSYMALTGRVHAVLTEDSDMLAYGCPRVLYKLDRGGMGEQVLLTDLPLVREINMAGFTHDMLLQMCIMAGCDFLPNLPGVGIKKAHTLMRKHRDFVRAVRTLRFTGLAIPPGYEVRFQRTLWLFRHQRIFCPDARMLTHLRPLPPGGLGAADLHVAAALPGEGPEREALEFLGPPMDAGVAAGIADGELDPSTLQPFDLASIYRGCPCPPRHLRPLLGPPPPPHPLPHSLSQHASQPGSQHPHHAHAAHAAGGGGGGHARRGSWGPGGAASQGAGHQGAAARHAGKPPVPPNRGIMRYYQSDPAASQPFRPVQPGAPRPGGGGGAHGGANVVTLTGQAVAVLPRDGGGSGGAEGAAAGGAAQAAAAAAAATANGLVDSSQEQEGVGESPGGARVRSRRRLAGLSRSASAPSGPDSQEERGGDAADADGGGRASSVATGSLFGRFRRGGMSPGAAASGEVAPADSHQAAPGHTQGSQQPLEGGSEPSGAALELGAGAEAGMAGAMDPASLIDDSNPDTAAGAASMGGASGGTLLPPNGVPAASVGVAGGSLGWSQDPGGSFGGASAGATEGAQADLPACSVATGATWDSQRTAGCGGSQGPDRGAGLPGRGGMLLGAARPRHAAQLAFHAMLNGYQPQASDPGPTLSQPLGPSALEGAGGGGGRRHPVSALAALGFMGASQQAPSTSQPPSPSRYSQPDALCDGRAAAVSHAAHHSAALAKGTLGPYAPAADPFAFDLYGIDDADAAAEDEQACGRRGDGGRVGGGLHGAMVSGSGGEGGAGPGEEAEVTSPLKGPPRPGRPVLGLRRRAGGAAPLLHPSVRRRLSVPDGLCPGWDGAGGDDAGMAGGDRGLGAALGLADSPPVLRRKGSLGLDGSPAEHDRRAGLGGSPEREEGLRWPLGRPPVSPRGDGLGGVGPAPHGGRRGRAPGDVGSAAPSGVQVEADQEAALLQALERSERRQRASLLGELRGVDREGEQWWESSGESGGGGRSGRRRRREGPEEGSPRQQLHCRGSLESAGGLGMSSHAAGASPAVARWAATGRHSAEGHLLQGEHDDPAVADAFGWRDAMRQGRAPDRSADAAARAAGSGPGGTRHSPLGPGPEPDQGPNLVAAAVAAADARAAAHGPLTHRTPSDRGGPQQPRGDQEQAGDADDGDVPGDAGHEEEEEDVVITAELGGAGGFHSVDHMSRYALLASHALDRLERGISRSTPCGRDRAQPARLPVSAGRAAGAGRAAAGTLSAFAYARPAAGGAARGGGGSQAKRGGPAASRRPSVFVAPRAVSAPSQGPGQDGPARAQEMQVEAGGSDVEIVEVDGGGGAGHRPAREALAERLLRQPFRAPRMAGAEGSGAPGAGGPAGGGRAGKARPSGKEQQAQITNFANFAFTGKKA